MRNINFERAYGLHIAASSISIFGLLFSFNAFCQAFVFVNVLCSLFLLFIAKSAR